MRFQYLFRWADLGPEMVAPKSVKRSTTTQNIAICDETKNI